MGVVLEDGECSSRPNRLDNGKSIMKKRSLPPSSCSISKRITVKSDIEVPWESLPEEILVTIVELLTSPDGVDFLGFSAVCRSWRSAAAKVDFTLVRQMPWILLRTTSDSRETRVFNPSETKFYRFLLPKANWETLCCSVKGWVATTEDDGHIQLMNLDPFSQPPTRLCLPPLPGFTSSIVGKLPYVEKLCIPFSPTEVPNGMAVAIYDYSKKLAFMRLGSQAWTTICFNKRHIYYVDVVFYKGRFYASNMLGEVVKLDLRKRVTVKVASSRPMDSSMEPYLVESGGDLLQVAECWETRSKKVFKLDVETGAWEAVRSLGERSLFIGSHSYSFSVCAAELFGCRSNCIYTLDTIRDNHDYIPTMGVYCLDTDKDVEIQVMPTYPESMAKDDDLFGVVELPVWVSPHVWWRKNP